MPRIPVYTQKVEQGRLPGARVDLSMSPQDVTGGVEKGLAKAGDLVKDEMAKARKEQREARLMLAYSELGNARLEIQGVATKDYLGESALKNDLETQTTAMLKKRAEEVIASMPDDEMRNAVRRTYLREEEGLRAAVMGHVAKQGEAVAENGYKGVLTTARNKAIAANGEGRDAVAGREELLAAVEARAGTLGWSKEETELRKKAELTGFHEGVIDRKRLASPADANTYLTLHEGEMLPEVVTKLRAEMKVGVVADKAEQEVRRIEGLTADPEERVKLVNALDPEVAPKARGLLREREALAEEAHGDVQKGYVGTLRKEIASRTIWTDTDLEKQPLFQKLDDEHKASLLEHLEAKRRQAAAESRARESHAAGREQTKRDLEFTTWYARQPAAVRLTIDVDGEAAKRGASVTAANRAGMLQLSTRTNLPRMFDQSGFAKKAEEYALTQWPGNGAKMKAIRSGYVSELRSWHDAEVEAGREVKEDTLKARAARLLQAGEETTDGWVNDNMTRFEAERRGLGFREFPADQQENPLVREQGGAPATPPSAPAGPVRVKTRAEALALPKGTRFVDPNGVERIR